jgi:uncharacterized protein (DUF1684 family)
MGRVFLAGVILLLGCEPLPPPPSLSSPEEHRGEILQWQEERVARLREPDSWLSVVNLHWLMPGETLLGSGENMDLVLPGQGVPAWVGTLTLRGQGTFDWSFSPEAAAQLPAREATDLRFRVDGTMSPPVIRWGSLSWFVIERYGEFALRVRDSNSEAHHAFRGIETFPIDSSWRILARFEPYDPPREIASPNVLDIPSTSASPGAAVFEMEGRELRLDLTGDLDSGHLFVVFGDATNGVESYSGGRFLSLPAPNPDNWIVVDFNRAYNPPCVFTPYATCPVPPSQNVLPVRVEAGEKMVEVGAHAHPEHR